MSERPKCVELDSELAAAYAATFIPRWDRYVLQQPDGSYLQIKQPLTVDLVLAHLCAHYQGRSPVTLGAYALNGDSIARWICLDADDEAQWTGLWQMAHVLDRDGVPSYPELSRRGGGLGATY
jgi:hypothetical protein